MIFFFGGGEAGVHSFEWRLADPLTPSGVTMCRCSERPRGHPVHTKWPPEHSSPPTSVPELTERVDLSVVGSVNRSSDTFTPKIAFRVDSGLIVNHARIRSIELAWLGNAKINN
jgi:hypothetical protein